MTRTRLSLSVYTDDPNVVARMAEQLARTAAGLSLEGIETFLAIGPDEDTSL